MIYEQGQDSNALYIVRTGKVKLQAYVKLQMGNKWPIGGRLWEEVKLDKTVAVDVKEVLPSETFGGHELSEDTQRTTRACAKLPTTVLVVSRSNLYTHFLKSDVEALLGLSKVVLQSSEEMQLEAKAKLSRLKDHVNSRQKKAIADSIVADFNYTGRTSADSLRSGMMRKWIGGFNQKSKQENLVLLHDIVDVSKSIKYVTKRRSLKKNSVPHKEL